MTILFSASYFLLTACLNSNLHFLQHEQEDGFFRDTSESGADSESKYSETPEDVVWHVHGPQVHTQLGE